MGNSTSTPRGTWINAPSTRNASWRAENLPEPRRAGWARRCSRTRSPRSRRAFCSVSTTTPRRPRSGARISREKRRPLAKMRRAALLMPMLAKGTARAGAGRANPSRVSPATLLKRQASSVRMGSGRAAKRSKAARLRASHHSGSGGSDARWASKAARVKAPTIGAREAVVAVMAGFRVSRRCLPSPDRSAA